MNNCKLVLGNWWLLVGSNIKKSQKLLIWSCLSMLHENRRIPLMIWGEKISNSYYPCTFFFQLQRICSCIKIKKFSRFSSVLSFHYMSTQMVPRTNNDLNTKGVIRSHNSKKDRQYSGIKKKNKETNKVLQNTSQKTKYWATKITLRRG
jgi:hypothetical protein